MNKPPLDLSVDDILRASRAEPGYGIEVKGLGPFADGIKVKGLGRFADGTITLPNPTWSIFTEVSSMLGNKQQVIDIVLSLGTSFEQSTESRPIGILSKLLHWQTWHKQALVFDDDLTKKVDMRMQDLTRRKGVRYYRIDVTGSWTGEGPYSHLLKQIKEVTDNYLGSDVVRHELQTCATALVERRRRRARTDRWESSEGKPSRQSTQLSSLSIADRPNHNDTDSSGTVRDETLYRCPLGPCELPLDYCFRARESLIIHLIISHRQPPPDAANREMVYKLLEQGKVRPKGSE